MSRERGRGPPEKMGEMGRDLLTGAGFGAILLILTLCQNNGRRGGRAVLRARGGPGPHSLCQEGSR